MAEFDVSRIAEAEIAYTEAGEAFDQAYEAVGKAQAEESEAGRELEDLYSEAFQDGIIIQKIIPGMMRYLAGYSRPTYLFVDGDPEPVYRTLDEGHADSLRGAYASDVDVSALRYFRLLDDAHKPQIQPKISFEVHGTHTNTQPSSGLESVFDPSKTSYSGELRAVKWRLPTEAEVEQFGTEPAGAT